MRRMRGCAALTLAISADLVCIHHRPLASADGQLRGHARYGECAYIVHYGALWVTLRALKMARRRPVGLSGVAFLLGYARAAVSGTERVPDAAYRSFTRRELRGRMLAPLGRWRRRWRDEPTAAARGDDSPLALRA